MKEEVAVLLGSPAELSFLLSFIEASLGQPMGTSWWSSALDGCLLQRALAAPYYASSSNIQNPDHILHLHAQISDTWISLHTHTTP